MNSPGKRLDLAHRGPFGLGALRVEPAIRLVRNGADSQIVEPRVMQLLVAFHEARGNVLSRDDLVDQCWGGVIVGDNAVQRAISQVRKLGATIGAGSFEIETVRGVGYRLIEQGKAASGTDRSAFKGPLSRRSTMALLGVGAAAAAAPLLWSLGKFARSSEAARTLQERADIALRDEDGESCKQAIAMLKSAVRDSPRFADAWASLSVAYWQRLIGEEGAQADQFAELARSSAKQALSIDSGNVRALGALAMLRPDSRDWRGALRELARIPNGKGSWVVLRWMGWVSSDLGEWESAIGEFERALAIQSLLPQVRRDLAVAYWGAGKPVETEQALAEATKLWPASYGLWEFQFRYLALTGSYRKAERLVTDDSAQPLGLSPTAVSKRLRLLDALDGKGHRDDVIHDYLAEAKAYPLNVVRVAQILAALDAREELYSVLEGFLLGRGPFAPPPSHYAIRPTYFLFLPPVIKFRYEPRFAEITKAIGLTPKA